MNDVQQNYKPTGIEASATTSAVTLGFTIDHLVFLSNDGTDNIAFTWDNGATWTLKPGDQITDYPIHSGHVSVQANSGTQPFRAWGLML